MTMVLNRENLDRISRRLREIGLPQTLMVDIVGEARKVDGDYFYVSHRMRVGNEPMEVSLGFQERDDGHFMPGLVGFSLPESQRSLYLFPLSDLNVQEAYNMIQGRAVWRPAGLDSENDYWLRLEKDRSFHGLNMPVKVDSRLSVRKWLGESPLAGVLGSEGKERIVADLQAGDRVDLGHLMGKRAGMYFLEARPEKNGVELRNGYGKALDIDEFARGHSPTLLKHRR